MFWHWTWKFDSEYEDRPTMWVVHSCHIDLVNLCNKWHREYFCQCGYTTCSKGIEVQEHPLFPYNKQYMKEQYYYNFGHWQFLTPTKEQIEEMKSVFLMWKVHEYCQRWTMVWRHTCRYQRSHVLDTDNFFIVCNTIAQWAWSRRPFLLRQVRGPLPNVTRHPHKHIWPNPYWIDRRWRKHKHSFDWRIIRFLIVGQGGALTPPFVVVCLMAPSAYTNELPNVRWQNLPNPVYKSRWMLRIMLPLRSPRRTRRRYLLVPYK